MKALSVAAPVDCASWKIARFIFLMVSVHFATTEQSSFNWEKCYF